MPHPHHEPQSGDHGTVVPPVPIPNTEVKRCCADDSMAKGYAKVGRCQIKHHPASRKRCGVFCARELCPKHNAPAFQKIVTACDVGAVITFDETDPLLADHDTNPFQVNRGFRRRRLED